jgi:hypothetical protein
MAIINLLWETTVLVICSIIQVIGVIVEGIAKVLFAFSTILEKEHDRVLGWKSTGKKQKVHIDIDL